jgi:sigma-B regulation protein RsbU (phosphoserine phosphatase)
MSMTMVLIRASAAGTGDPAEILNRVNANLSRENPNSMFVTMFIAVFDPRSGELVYANGGHNAPLVRSAGGAVRRLSGAAGMIVGAFGDALYGSAADRLGAGDVFFLYTDGLTEAMNADLELFGDARMEETLARCPCATAAAVVADMADAVKKHVEQSPASDDLTMLCLWVE